ncbi:MAG TPA: outer membrane beta-barrel protein [Gemmatimonadales bacterium]|nr:outer membrane beta-barrel protein [Gemmatimonadales bacterium]
MKRWSLLFTGILGLAIATPAGAQYAMGPQAVIGLAGGATNTDLANSGTSTDTRWGGMAGLFYGRRLSTGTAAMLEANWVQQGGGDTRLDYISVPLTFGATTGRGMGRVRPYIGVSVDFKIGCSASSSLVCDAASGTQWALPLGLTFGKASPSGSFVGLDVRYAVPLSHAFDNSNVYNRSWQFRLVLAKPAGKQH